MEAKRIVAQQQNIAARFNGENSFVSKTRLTAIRPVVNTLPPLQECTTCHRLLKPRKIKVQLDRASDSKPKITNRFQTLDDMDTQETESPSPWSDEKDELLLLLKK